MATNATLKQVARRAGVAFSTASYALNGGPKPVAQATRERVLAAAKELGYSSNLTARGLKTGRGMSLGVMMPEVRSHLTSYQLAGVEEAAHALGYTIMLWVYRSEIDRALLVQREIVARRMDGIVCLFETAGNTRGKFNAVLTGLRELGLPFVSTYHDPIEGVPGDYLLVDHEQGGYDATRHLLAGGRRAVAFVGPMHLYSALKRLDGFRRAHAEIGLAPREDLIVGTSSFLAQEGERAGEQLLARSPRPDAVFAPNDYMAATLMRTLRQSGLRVPEDVAVIGYDDGLLCEALDPPLSSVRCPLEEMGRAAVNCLVARLDKPDNWLPQVQTLPCELVLRQSG